MGDPAGMGEGLEPTEPPELTKRKLNQTSLFL